jgi:hypothetical protein
MPLSPPCLTHRLQPLHCLPQAFAEGADSLCPIWSHLASHASWPPWVVVTGITPLLGSSALSAWRALIHAAHSRGGRVSLDLNHRPALGSFGNLWGLVAPMLACVTLLVLSEGNVHTLAALLLKQEHGAGASGVQEQQGEGAPVGKENPGEASSSVDAADGSGRFWVLLSRLREVLGVPMLACSIKRPIPPPTRPNTHAATGTSTAPTALAVPSAGTACPPSGTAPLPPHSGTPSTDRRLPTRRWSLVATPTGVQSTFDMPTEHSPLEPLGGGDAWLAGFVSGILPQPGSECHDAGSGAALTTPASLASPATVAPLPARLQSALRRGDLLAALQQATHGDMSSVTKIGLDAAETRWHGRTAQMIPGGTAHEEQPAAAPQRTTRPSERSAMAAPQGGVNQHPHPDQLPNQDHPSDDTDTPNWHELRLRLRRCRLLPVISVDDPSDAVPLARALAAGGATVVEVVLRTPAAAEALSQIADHVPELMLGAGTVLTIEQASSRVSRLYALRCTLLTPTTPLNNMDLGCASMLGHQPRPTIKQNRPNSVPPLTSHFSWGSLRGREPLVLSIDHTYTASHFIHPSSHTFLHSRAHTPFPSPSPSSDPPPLPLRPRTLAAAAPPSWLPPA